MGTFGANSSAARTRYAPPEPRAPSLSLTISPQFSLNAREAEYQITVHNTAEHAESLALFVDSPALDLQYTFDPSYLRVAGNSYGTARLLVRAWSAPEPRAYPFVISALRAGSNMVVAQASGQFVPEVRARRAFAYTPVVVAAGLLLLICATGAMALFAWQVFRAREGGAVVAHATLAPTSAVAIPVTGAANGSPATAPTSAPAAVPPTSTPGVPAGQPPAPTHAAVAPSTANPEVALVNYYNNVDKRAYAVSWASLSPRFQSEVNQNDLTAYENFWNSVAQVTVLNTKLLAQVNDIATVRTTLRYAYSDGRVVEETTTFRLLADASRHQWLIDAVVK